MKRVAASYERPLVEASRSALLELALSLRAYRGALVLVGGWVPYFLLQTRQAADGRFEHVGSIDIDWVVDPSGIGAMEYATIVEIIKGRGWAPWEKNLFSYTKRIPSPVDGKLYEIRVDFLASEPEKLAGKHRHREIQPDLKARTMRGAPLALAHRSQLLIEGQLPGDGNARAELLMADVVGCVGMKGLALGSRYSEKDAYDLFAVLENYGGGPRDVAAAVRPFVREPLMAEAIGYIREMFRDEKEAGSVWVADFHTEQRNEAHQRLAVRAFMVVSRFLEALN